jgi:replicative DNA helicase
MTTPAEIEVALLSSVRSPEDLRLCTDRGLTSESFDAVPAVHPLVWDHVVKTLREQREPPLPADLERLFGFTACEPGDVAAYADRVRERDVYRLGKAAIWRAGLKLETDPSAALTTLRADLSQTETCAQRALLTDRDALARLERFDETRERRASNEFIGIPTGLAYYDGEKLGWLGGDIAVIVGTLGVGKSWVLMHMAVTAWDAGKRVLVISPEMSGHAQSLRFDVLGAHAHSIQLSHHRLRRGEEDREAYRSWLSIAARRSGDFVIVDAPGQRRPFTFDDAWNLVAEHRPDLLVIDGLHLLGVKGSGRSGWEVLKDGGEMLKALAHHDGIPILCVHQATREAGKDESSPPGISQIGYGYSVGQIADHLIALSHAKPRTPLRRSFITRKVRDDEQANYRHELIFDVDHGCIEQLPFDPNQCAELPAEGAGPPEDRPRY